MAAGELSGGQGARAPRYVAAGHTLFQAANAPHQLFGLPAAIDHAIQPVAKLAHFAANQDGALGRVIAVSA